MTTIPTYKDPYSVVADMLRQEGIGPRDLRGGQYDAMVEAVRSGDIGLITMKRGTDGKADITIDGIDATSPMFRNVNKPDTCPDFVPANLCDSYAKITDFLPSAPNAGAVLGSVAKAAGYDDLGAKLEDYGMRLTFVILGIVLVGIGVYFSVQGSAKDVVKEIIAAKL